VIHTHPDVARTAFARFLLVLPFLAVPLSAQAQGQGNGWFVPDTAKHNTPPGRPQATPAGQRPAPAPLHPPMPDASVPVPGSEPFAPLVEPQGPLPPLQVQLPPMPDLPLIQKGPPTPAAIVGILSVPDVLRISTAYQMADKEITQRRNRVSEDGQKEQNTLRELGQNFANERAKLTPEQIRAREKDYADRVNESRRKFSERARIIQEAGQYVMAQIERVIEQVAQQVAASRGVNLVLNRAQVLGTTADFDLTPQVADVLNKVLPTVVIPPDGVSPTKFNAPVAGPRVSATPEAAPAKKN
jgi:Skp family chaperone for outer membrane proteins